MTKLVIDAAFDAALAYIADNATVIHVCSGDPADRAAAITNSLADIAVTAGAGNGDFTLADGDTSGRKLTVAEQAAVDIDVTGTAAHICIISGTVLLAKTSCTSQALSSGGTVTIPAHDYEIRDPT